MCFVECMDGEIDVQDDDVRFVVLKKQVLLLFCKLLFLCCCIFYFCELMFDGGFQVFGRKVKKKINFIKCVGKMGKNGKMEK